MSTIHIDEDGNVIPEQITPENPGLYKKYNVPYPDSGDVVTYYFTDEQIISIVTQYGNYQAALKNKLYPK